MNEYDTPEVETDGPMTMDRRRFVKRAATTSALVWAAPTVLNVAPAFAVGGSEICQEIDGFTVPLTLTSTAPPGAVSSVGPTQTGGDILDGGTRQVSLLAEAVVTSPRGNGTTLTIGSGNLIIDNGLNIKSVATLTYDQFAGMDADLSDRDRFRLNFFSAETGTVVVSIRLIDADGTSEVASTSVALTGTTSSPDSKTAEIPFSDYSSDMDFSKITTLILSVDTPNSLDVLSMEFRACYIN